MKKHNLMLLGALGLLLASCSNEEANNPTTNGNVTFSVNLPKNLTTRDIGDGKSATNLKVIVYSLTSSSQETYTYQFTNNSTFPNNEITTNVSLELVNGKSYKIVFFATTTAADAVYSITEATGTMTVDYSKMTSDNNKADAYDCFYGSYEITNLSNSVSKDVTLSRPIAQINWGTTLPTDPNTSNFTSVFGTDREYILTSLTATGLYDTFDLLNGTASISEAPTQTSITLSNFEVPGNEFTINETSYTNIAMQYVLAPKDQSTNLELTLTITDGRNSTATSFIKTIEVSAVPVQANYQTNIYGSLLTTNVSFNVTKSNTWSPYSPNNVSYPKSN